jgi:hypothetical protein
MTLHERPTTTPKPLASRLQALARRDKISKRHLAINVCATGEYSRPRWVQAHAVRHCLDAAALAERGITASVILTGDSACAKLRGHWQSVTGLPVQWVKVLPEAPDALAQSDGRWNYSRRAQILIAKMREASFASARKAGAEYFWSLDSDVFPTPLALASALDTLPLFGGLYSIVANPYPSQGGGSYLCGHGSASDPIHSDFTIHERRCPKMLRWLHARFDAWLKQLDPSLEKAKKPNRMRAAMPDRIARAGKWLRDRVNQYPPVATIWELQARGYRRRGWFDFAYPGIGLGSIVPSDWCGMGCTLLSRAALAVSSFSLGEPGGYDGGGTEDLYLCYRRWLPAGLRIAALPGAPASHASRDGDGYVLHRASFERGGECDGHLRRHNLPLDWQSGQSARLLPRAFFEV